MVLGAAVLALTGGGIAAAVDVTGSTSAAPGPAAGSGATLNSLLSSAGLPSASTLASTARTAGPRAAFRAGRCARLAARLRAAGHPVAARAVTRACFRRLLRLRLLGAEHGQVTFRTRRGPRTLAFERGAIRSVSGKVIVVQAADGTTWTWNLTSRTIIREDRQRRTTRALADGLRVFVAGPVSGGAKDARLIVIRPVGGRH
jgi:hypothetical protein